MPITAKVIADSISEEGKRLTTLQLVYPRFIHAELMTHRVFSRNASSSRAIPVKKVIDMVRNEPAMPIHWGLNQPGMQADEQLTGEALRCAKQLWLDAAENAAEIAESMMEVGLHKQVANRILEPFQHINVVLTATEFDNWNELRRHKDAQPEIQHLATEMAIQMDRSTPKLLQHGEWHLPYVTEDDLERIKASLQGAILPAVCGSFETAVANRAASVSAARCCRVSYLKHDGTASSIEEDLALCDKLAGARPIHASPFEHQATPDGRRAWAGAPDSWNYQNLHGNFVGWIQHRKLIEQSFKS